MDALTRELAKGGHAVAVICPFPSYPYGIKRAEDKGKVCAKEEWPDGRTVVHTYSIAFQDRSALKRLLSWITFCFTSLLAWPHTRGADVIVASSGPLFVVVPAMLFAFLRQAAFVLDVRDVWPPRAADVLPPVPRRIVSATLRVLELLAYRRAQRIVAATRGVGASVIERGALAAKTVTIRSGEDLAQYPESAPDEATEPLGRALGAKDLVICSGTIGLYQAPGVVVEAAHRWLQRCPKAWMVFLGDGPLRSKVEAQAKALRIERIHFGGAVPLAVHAHLLRRARVGVVSLDAGNREQMLMTVPRRMVDYMVAGIPVAYAGEGEGAELVRGFEAGLTVPPGDSVKLASAIESMLCDTELWEKLSSGAQRLATEQFSVRLMGDQFMEQIRLCSEPPGSR